MFMCFSRKRQFVHKMFVHNFCAPWPPPPNQQIAGFPLVFLFKGPQTELRTFSQNCEQTLQKLRNKQNYEQMGISEFMFFKGGVFSGYFQGMQFGSRAAFMNVTVTAPDGILWELMNRIADYSCSLYFQQNQWTIGVAELRASWIIFWPPLFADRHCTQSNIQVPQGRCGL